MYEEICFSFADWAVTGRGVCDLSRTISEMRYDLRADD